MKRSEMLSKIASVIINYNEAHCIINRDKAMEMAETILRVQEENGMLPPLNDWSLHTDGDKAGADNVRYYTWESEDEEK